MRIVLLCLLCCSFGASCATPPFPSAPPPTSNTPKKDKLAIIFKNRCSPGRKITLGAVGDLLMHKWLQKQAVSHPKRFRSLWSTLEPYIAQVDLMYGNLETAVAPGVAYSGRKRKDPGFVYDHKVYTGWPRFNVHPHLIKDLKTSGFSVLSTANNHSLDRKPIGINRTIDSLDKHQMPYTGTRRSTHRRRNVRSTWHTITSKNNINIAWLACTMHTNYKPDPHHQVLQCYKHRKKVLALVRKLSKDKKIHAIVVTPHFGKEYKHKPHKRQIQLAKAIIDAGAIAVIGNHPHVIQPWTRHQTSDGREGFIAYALGNFVSSLPGLPVRSSIMLAIELTQPKPEAKLVVSRARYLPLYMKHTKQLSEVISSNDPIVHKHIQGFLGKHNMSPLHTGKLFDPSQCPTKPK